MQQTKDKHVKIFKDKYVYRLVVPENTISHARYVIVYHYIILIKK